MTTLENKIYSVALSILSSPSFNNVWGMIGSNSPRAIFEKISAKRIPSCQNYINAVYKGDPVEAASSIIDMCGSKSVGIIDYWDHRYPALLREIHQPPVVLYCRGSSSFERSIGIVGTRKTDRRSSDIARRISSELARAGYVIVSGMAVGIDREAHLGALQNNRPTVGILASGIDIISPSFNRDIYTSILSSGNSALLSEYPPGITADKWTFVRRNRIISGMSLGTVIVKAGEKSGALITAMHALEQNREVFACPGFAFDAAYQGCHNLIKNGAVLVSSTEDILRELSDYDDRVAAINDKKSVVREENAEFDFTSSSVRVHTEYKTGSIDGRIMELLSRGVIDVDGIIRELSCSVRDVNESLIGLELSGSISRDGNMISRYQ